MADKIYPEGIYTFKPHKGAPEFVLGTICINIDDFNAWIDSHNGYLTEYNGKSQLKLSILKGREGRINLQVDNYETGKPPEPSF
jgi:hypothetical protein